MERDRPQRGIGRLEAYARPCGARVHFESHVDHHPDKVVPLHRWSTLLRALVRTQNLCQKSGALPVHLLEPRAEVPFLLRRRLLRCLGRGLLLAAET